MKALLLILILLASAIFGRTLFLRSDIADLEPVEVIALRMDRGRILVCTDSGQQGVGTDLAAAFQDLKHRASGDIFLDTVDYVILGPGCEDLAEPLLAHMRPACRVCLELGQTDLAAAAAFLRIHEPDMTLMASLSPSDIPVLMTKEGRMELVS